MFYRKVLYNKPIKKLTCADHFTGRENQRRRSGITNSHDDCGKAFRIVLGITCVHGDFFQVQFTTIQVNCGDNILESW